MECLKSPKLQKLINYCAKNDLGFDLSFCNTIRDHSIEDYHLKENFKTGFHLMIYDGEFWDYTKFWTIGETPDECIDKFFEDVEGE